MSNAERQARYRAKHRARPQLEGTQADALAARIRAVQDEMVAQVMEIGELKPHLQTQIEGWFREMQQIRLALLGR
ncbi:MAG TPA: hypothetical protein VJ548_13625 [Azospira sp.]|nr:hypothetical protein [Azospira sp.]